VDGELTTRIVNFAWEALTYAVSAQLDHHDQFEKHREWVLYWVAGVALLRAVGHVLEKVDACKPDIKSDNREGMGHHGNLTRRPMQFFGSTLKKSATPF
jgi:hypothetical protein